MDAVARLLLEARESLDVLGDEPGVEEHVNALLLGSAERLDALEIAANFDREYDGHSAVLSINAGAGGVDAADWTQMLARMYARLA